MKAIIMNYAISGIETADLPDDLFVDDESGRDNSERIEEYLTDELGYNLSEINYMTISDEYCPVYRWDGNEPYAEI